MAYQQINDYLLSLANPEIASHSLRFFKTAPGEYGFGDKFLGIRVPVIRQAVKKPVSKKSFRDYPLARFVGYAVAGVEPRIMGIGPAPASEKVLSLAGLDIADMDVIELNEAFAAQGLASLRRLGVDDDAEHVNPNGGAIALGHPLGMSGARLVTTAAYELRRRNGRYALCTMCIGVGQGIAIIIERP